MSRRFPEDFLWGVATSSHQIEGAFDAGGRGESIWDRFARTPGKIADGSDGSVACDHYHRWRDDVRLLDWLGVDAYRFSIAWSRVLPTGRGRVNEEGLAFYDALVDELLERKIKPLVTLYHWDLPQLLQDSGGWAARETAEAFTEYSAVVAQRLGDRVAHWVTHNEPWCITTLGHEHGEHAPGHQDGAESLAVAHHVLLSHGWAVDELRRESPNSEVGIVLNLTPGHAASSSEADVEAVRRFDGAFNRWYLDPIFHGAYPEDAIADRVRLGHLESEDLPFVREGDMDVIRTPLDFLGVNYYSRAVLAAGKNGDPVAAAVIPEDRRTDMGWEIYPEGLHELLLRVDRDYTPRRIYITENGAAFSDGPDASNRITDVRRIDFMRSHLEAVKAAMTDGVPVHGYFAWSLLDNFEWAYGYDRRFGLVWVDYETQERIPKDSALWYRDLLAADNVAGAESSADVRRIP